MMNQITQTLTAKVVRQYDVAVCGGGFAGISAALAAARQGKRVVLFERLFLLGGLATSGLITIYLPLCDGMGRQVSFGIAEELLRLSISMGAEAKYPDNWLTPGGSRTENDKRFQVRYNAQLFAILAEQLLCRAGVDILYGTYVVGVEKSGDKIRHLITENKSGRQAWTVQSVVDATGDCDIASLSGAPTETYKQGNILAGWFYGVGKDGYNLYQLGASDIPDEDKTEEKRAQDLGVRRFLGLDGEEISEFVRASHAATMEHVVKKRENDPELLPVTLTTLPQIRMTRRICGEYTIATSELHKRFEDSVGMVSNWKKRGPVYEVPFRTLYSKAVKNLIVAGRCTSCTEGMWDIMRVIPCCAVTGEAAGVAAAMTDDFSTLDIKALQATLQEQGVVLHEDELPMGSAAN